MESTPELAPESASTSASSSASAPASTHNCKKCKTSFPTSKALHQHLQTCGKEQEHQHCRCAAVEKELQDIKGLLAGVLASKGAETRPEDPNFMLFKEAKRKDSESQLEYIDRLEGLFLQLPISLQYHRNTRWQLYENLRSSTPKVFTKDLRKCWDKKEVFELFGKIKDEIEWIQERKEDKKRERKEDKKWELAQKDKPPELQSRW